MSLESTTARACLITAAMLCAMASGCSGGGGGGSGGTGSGLPACDALQADRFVVRVDVLDANGSSAVQSGTLTTLTGDVVEVGVGELPEGCAHSNGEAAWAKLTDANGVSWTVCVQSPGFTMPLQVGQKPTIEHHLKTGENWSDSRGVAIRIDGALVFFGQSTQGGGDIQLPPEISYASGEQLCFTDDSECGVTAYEVLVEAGGAQATLVQGMVADVGGYTFHVGRYGALTDPGGCETAGGAIELFVVPTH